MFEIVGFGYEILCEMVPFCVAAWLLRHQKGKYSAAHTGQHSAYLLLFALYVMAVFRVTGAGTIYEAIRAKNVTLQNRMQYINLIPFSRDISISGYVLNIVMCVPFGFLVPLIWEDMGRVSRILPAGFLFSLLLEVSQLLNIRGTDVDDLIMNTLGALAGFVVYLAFDKVTCEKLQLKDVDARELPIFVIVMYLGRCLFFNYLGLMNLWFGY